MIIKGSYLNVVDNTGGYLVQCIQYLQKKQKSNLKIGDLVVVVIKKMVPVIENFKIKKSDICFGILVRTKQNVVRKSGIYLNNDINGVVLLNKKYEPLGTRLIGVIYIEIEKTKYLKMMSLSKHLI
uniref:Ribosomal protein L14 n=1 Tax=Heterostelium pallidum TaxID=13642 RepID=Q5ILK7_HETPA|nr:ribosomal protein L14 [Heterostelium pallidum]AAU00603.1 ribosomal protein L14 [Heterostelium pallidum]